MGHAHRVRASRETSEGKPCRLTRLLALDLDARLLQTKHEYQGPIWLGFERLTVVPIQTKMVKENLLSKEEIQWLKVRPHYLCSH